MPETDVHSGKKFLKAVKQFFDGDFAVEPFSFTKKQRQLRLKQKVNVRKLNKSYYIHVPKPWIKLLGNVLAMELEFKPNPDNPFASEIIVKPCMRER